MKKIVKAATLFHILVLYCFIVSLYTAGISASGIHLQNDRSTSEEGYSPLAGIDLFTHTTKTQNVVNGLSKLPTFSLKNQISDFLAYRKATELFLFNSSSVYLFYARYTADRFPQTDIIFPFHYFW